MNTSWMKAQDRKRNFVAAASTACLYALAFAAALIIGRLLAQAPGLDLGHGHGRLGGTEGPSGEMPQRSAERALERPSRAALRRQRRRSPASRDARRDAPAPAPPRPRGATAASRLPNRPKARRRPMPGANGGAAKRPRRRRPSPAARPATRTFGSAPPRRTAHSARSCLELGSSRDHGFAGSQPGVPGGTGSVTFRGSEMGSALATTFGASSGQVGRNIYVPIYLYMPLPNKVGASIYQNIQAKETFRTYYQQSGSDWVLKSQAPLSQRGDFWTMLEAAGYDPSTADFRTERKLSPVVLEFTVGPITRNKVDLVDVRLTSTSGSSDVDEAVIYGFRQASFFNKTGNAISGKFVYSF